MLTLEQARKLWTKGFAKPATGAAPKGVTKVGQTQTKTPQARGFADDSAKSGANVTPPAPGLKFAPNEPVKLIYDVTGEEIKITHEQIRMIKDLMMGKPVQPLKITLSEYEYDNASIYHHSFL